MHIQRVSVNNNSFKSNIHNFGDDDIISQSRRKFLREKIYENIMPYTEILNSEKRLEEYELNKLITSLCGQKMNQDSLLPIIEKFKPKQLELPKKFPVAPNKEINHELIMDLPLLNIAPVSKNMGVYRGQSLQNNLNALKIVKHAGIERVIDLAGYDQLEEDCKNVGLEYSYYSYPPHYFVGGEMFKTEDSIKDNILRQCNLFGYSKDDSINHVNRAIEHWKNGLEQELNDFTNFIKDMQKGNLYIGCEYGTYTTDNALMLNAFFNPLYIRCPKYVTHYNRIFTVKFLNLYNNLKLEHKQQMGWTKEFDEYLLKKFKTFL